MSIEVSYTMSRWYTIVASTHLHTERPAAVNKLSNIPLTLAIAPRFRGKLEDKSRLITIKQ